MILEGLDEERLPVRYDVYLAVGHGVRPDGRFDPGAVGLDGRYEHYEATEVAAECVNALERSGVAVKHEVTGSGGPEDPNYSGSIKAINAGIYKCAVEIHFDWNKAPEGGFGHWYYAGRPIADAVLKRWREAGLPVRDSWHKQRTDLAFLKYTKPPAMLWECGRIQDFPAEVNRQMGETIAAGICDYLGLTYVPPPPDKPHYAVAVIGLGDIDSILAYLLARQHGFKWFKDDAGYQEADVDWLVKVGGGAVKAYSKQAGVAVSGDNRYLTANEVLAKVLDPAPPRRKPWA